MPWTPTALGLQMPAADAQPGGAPAGKPLSAQETFAALTRAQWDQYLSDYVPLENLMINYAMDPNAVNSAVAEARRGVAQTFEAQQASNQRRLRGLGLTLDPEEQQAADRSTALARSLADVSAANLTADRVRGRQQALMGNPAPNVRGL